jgi:large subunit ribosomal protein L21
MMYAVIRTGGKQYKVKAGDLIKVDLLEKSQGDEFDMEQVLFVSGKTSHVGEPTISNAKVTVVVAKQGKDKKILVFKKKRRKGYRKTQGHRQDFTQLFVKSIISPDGESESAELKVKEKTEDKPAKKTASKKKATKKKVTKKKTTKKKASKKKATKKKA